MKNSGKTTLLTGLIPLLRAQGLRVAVLNHDGHDYMPDVPGTDSFRLREAGAGVVGVFSSRRYSVTVEGAGADWETFSPWLKEVDLVLLEGGKASPYLKIEVVRRAVSRRTVCDPRTLLALCTDTDLAVPGVLSVELDDYPCLVRLIRRRLWPAADPGCDSF